MEKGLAVIRTIDFWSCWHTDVNCKDNVNPSKGIKSRYPLHAKGASVFAKATDLGEFTSLFILNIRRSAYKYWSVVLVSIEIGECRSQVIKLQHWILDFKLCCKGHSCYSMHSFKHQVWIQSNQNPPTAISVVTIISLIYLERIYTWTK